MGLFGGGNSTSQNQTNNTTTSTDKRVGTADQSSAYVAQDGSTQNVNITTSDPGAVKATADALALGATSNADTLSHISSDNKNAVLAAFSTSSDLLNTAKLISDSQQDTLRRSTADAISAASQSATLAAQTASDITHSALTTVGNVTSDYFSAAGSLSDLVSKSGVNNQQFATGLVDSVLQASQSQDAKNYDATLSTLVKIGGIIAASFAAILIFGKARA